ncbi:MAG: AIR synthase-related protein [Nitrososphaeria archaeon]
MSPRPPGPWTTSGAGPPAPGRYEPGRRLSPHVLQDLQGPRPGDVLVLVGNRTGRDGIAGATFASSALPEDLVALRPAVQIPDPLVEEGLIRFISAARGARAASGVTDLGGGGLVVAAAEMAISGRLGMDLDLTRIPSEGALADRHLMFSESNGRFLVEARRGSERDLERLMAFIGCAFARVGTVTGEGELVLRGRRGALELGLEDLESTWRRGPWRGSPC